MSQQLGFYLRQRIDKTIKIELLWYSTTPARTLSSEGVFPYTDKETIVSMSDLNNAIELITRKVSHYTKASGVIQSKLDRLDKALSNCKTAEAVEGFTNKMEEYIHDIEGYTAEIENWGYYKEKVEFIKEVFDQNSEDYDLYYYNC